MQVEWQAGVGLLAGVLAGAALAPAFFTWRSRRAPRAASAEATSNQCDAVTGLPSRAACEKQVTQAAAPDEPAFGLYVGLDGFRLINDAHGHAIGDAVLALAAQRLRALAGEQALLCRVAGDEFMLWADGAPGDGEALAARIVAAFAEPLALPPALTLTSGASVGVAFSPRHCERARLAKFAAVALRSVKRAGGGAHAVFDPRVAAEQREELQLARDLKQAAERGEFELFYQPKIDAVSLQITAAEALLRWRHPTLGMVSPTRFIPLAERHGLISRVGDWVLDEALRQAALWRKAGLRMRVAINVSGYQMRQDDFALRLERGLKLHGLQPGRFTCEITESVAMEDTAVTLRAFARLGKLGVHVSIDDFGTGHSSLASLRRLPAHELKIDRSFVTDLGHSEQARSIVAAIVQMARVLGMHVVAEGVETEAQRDELMRLGCDELQGWLFAKPMSARALGLWAMDGPADLSESFRPSLFKATQAFDDASRARVR